MDAEAVVDLFGAVGPVRARPMFGGLGIYLDGLMFGLVADGEIFLKADEETRAVFEAAGSVPFSYEARGRRISLRYLSLPPIAHDDDAALLRYAGLALDAARRAPPKARGARRRDGGGGGHDSDHPGGRRGARPRRPARPPS